MTSRKRQSLALTGLLVAFAAACLTIGGPASAAGVRGAGSSDLPVEFSMRSVTGQTVTAGDLRGQVVVLAFGASWLPLTRAQLQGLRKFADEYTRRGVAVYWVSADSDQPRSKNFASDDQLRDLAHKYNLTVLRDPQMAVSKRMGVTEIPSIVILDKSGNVAGGGPIGGIDPDVSLSTQLGDRLKAALGGEPAPE